MNAKKFRTVYSTRTRHHAKAGNPIVTEFTGRYNANGRLELIESGKYDIRQYIQSFADSVDLKLLLERFARGDVSALNRSSEGQYFDATLFPKTYAEALNNLHDGERMFSRLPDEVRQSFGNSYLNWLNTIGTEEWTSKMTVKQKEPVYYGDVKESVSNE